MNEGTDHNGLLESEWISDLLYANQLLDDELQKVPLASNPNEAFQAFEKFYAPYQLNQQVYKFKRDYHLLKITPFAIEAELEKINLWIKEAEKINLKDAIASKGGDQEEYIKLSKGYYRGYQMGAKDLTPDSLAAIVWGRYDLFKNWLKEKLQGNGNMPSQNITSIISEENKPTVAAIAIAHVFWAMRDRNKCIHSTNFGNWNTLYGIKSPHTLLREFNHYNIETNRYNPMPLATKKNVPPFIKRFKMAADFIRNKDNIVYLQLLKHIDVLEDQHIK